LRSIPNKLLGVIAMFSALLIILILPITDLGKSKGLQFRPISKIAFYIFAVNFLVLMSLGAKHVEFPYIQLGQISTIVYFVYFIIIVPILSIIENTLIDLEYLNNYSYSKNTVLKPLSNSSI
jgi:ubiquinol-cytochrome c reductase cytochrome b subunit